MDDSADKPLFSTGEITIPALDSNSRVFMERRSVCIFNDHLHTINVLSSGQFWLNHVSIDLRKMLKADAKKLEWTDKIDVDYLKNNANWKQKTVYGHLLPVAFSQSVGLTSNSQNMFLIFGFRPGFTDQVDLSASVYHPEKFENNRAVEGRWEQPIRLLAPEGGQKETGEIGIVGDSGGISATFIGENQLIVACSSMSGRLHKQHDILGDNIHLDYAQGILLMLFDVRDIKIGTSTEWRARSYRRIYLDVGEHHHVATNNSYHSGSEDLSRLHVESYSTCRNVDIDWFAIAPTKESATDEPEYYLAMNFTPGKASTQSDGYQNPLWRDMTFSTTFRLPLKSDGSGDIDDRQGHTFVNPAPQFYMLREGRESDLRRDPSGRLRRFSGPTANSGTTLDGHIGSLFTATDTLPDPANGFGTKGKDNVIFPPPHYATDDATLLVAGAFYLFNEGMRKSTLNEGMKNEQKVADTPLLEFILYGDCKFQARQYGRIRTVRYAKDLQRCNKKPTFVIGGYFDSAIPFPKQNFFGQVRDGEEIKIGSIRYGESESDETATRSSTDWRIGYENSGKTTKGFGVAWKIEVEAGENTKEKEAIEFSTGRGVSAIAAVKKLPDEPVEVEGSGMASFLEARFHFKGYQFFDAANNLINDGLTQNPALSSRISQQLITMHAGPIRGESFAPYLVEVGNLESYTAEAITKQMQSRGYHGKDYVADVLEPNALQIGGERKPMSFTWSDGSPTDASFNEIKRSFREHGWTFDGQFYAGVSGGVEVSLFGMGEASEMEVMGGVTVAIDRGTEETNTREWGLEMENRDWGPRSSQREDAVYSYSFDVYFLPAPPGSPTLWADELRNNLPEKGVGLTKSMIDPNSQCWRVAFVVTEIRYRNPNGTIRVDYPRDSS